MRRARLSPRSTPPLSGSTINNYNFVLIRNPGRSNGGLYARFAPLFSLLGQGDPVSGNVVPKSRCNLNDVCYTYAPAKFDVTWAYDFYSDFPIAPNPFSIANSLAAGIFVTNLLGPTQTRHVPSVNGNTYTTVVPDDLAVLEPLRLPGRILGLAGINLPFPDPLDAVADAVQPALVILVNIGYSDVVTPSEGGDLQPDIRSVQRPQQAVPVGVTADFGGSPPGSGRRSASADRGNPGRAADWRFGACHDQPGDGEHRSGKRIGAVVG